jgi:anti-sigma regulatory factor (Ser/Thr protein kinase)
VELNDVSGAAKGLTFQLACTGRRRKASVDVMKMEQVFNNLLSNAVKFAPENSRIQVNYEDDGSGMLKICVEDQGPGIPEKDLQNIFESYYQVTRGDAAPLRCFGVGLGLSIVSTVMELHHGTVAAENLPGQGCRFTLKLPLKTIRTYSCLAVMIIDPRSVIFDTIEPVAQAKDISCFTVKSAAEAVRTYEFEAPDMIFVKRKDLSQDISSFLCNVKLENPSCTIVTILNSGEPPDNYLDALSLQQISKSGVDGCLEGLFRTLQWEAPQP